MEGLILKTGIKVRDSLRLMKVGDVVEFPYRKVKPGSLRTAATLLKAEGRRFVCTEKDLSTSIRVTRIA
jgi:hypothetical protein